jgi:hypothetical protein
MEEWSAKVKSRDYKLVANFWTEFAAQDGEAQAADGKEAQNPLFFLGGYNFRKGQYLSFCRSHNSQWALMPSQNPLFKPRPA